LGLLMLLITLAVTGLIYQAVATQNDPTWLTFGRSGVEVVLG
jgi:hypothetical protein